MVSTRSIGDIPANIRLPDGPATPLAHCFQGRPTSLNQQRWPSLTDGWRPLQKKIHQKYLKQRQHECTILVGGFNPSEKY